MDSDQTLQPGMIIAPQITIKTAQSLVENLYKLHVISIKELNSYDDKNYRIEVSSQTDNPYIKEVCQTGYVLKVLNKMDTPKQHVAAEHDMSKVLTKAGIICPVPELNINGEDRSLEKLPIETQDCTESGNKDDETHSLHLVRLMKYIPGQILHSIPYTADILLQSGELIGRIDKALQDYSHPALTNHKTIWSLKSVPDLIKFIHAVTDEDDKKCVLEVIEAFKREVEPNYKKFQPGVIHGDYNEQNIIVDKRSEKYPDTNQNENSEHCIVGVIDLGDSHHCYIVMEVAIAIMYHMVESNVIDPFDAGGYILKGYLQSLNLNSDERDALRTLVAARYCQSLVMGAYSYMQDPGNEYLLVTAKRGWGQLRGLWKMSKEELYKRWQTIIDQK